MDKDMGAKPDIRADPDSVIRPDTLHPDRNIHPVRMVISPSDDIASGTDDHILSDFHGAMVGGLDNGLGVDSGTVSDSDFTVFTGYQDMVGKNDVVPQPYGASIGVVPAIQNASFADDHPVSEMNTAGMPQGDTLRKHTSPAAGSKQPGPHGLSQEQSGRARNAG
jgi:hypothetical protein